MRINIGLVIVCFVIVNIHQTSFAQVEEQIQDNDSLKAEIESLEKEVIARKQKEKNSDIENINENTSENTSEKTSEQKSDKDLLSSVALTSTDETASLFDAGPAPKSNKPHTKATELALFEDIPMVITPGKKLQPITESPASVYVITAEDIKESGAINLYDVLRQVPGMDVVTSTLGQGDFSMRGFSDLASNKTLLLIDGRSLYLPLQGLQFWEQIPVQMEEIERIEVVKGPVASLYGANANLGLVNIITKKPKQMLGGTYSRTGGTRGASRDALMYAGEKGNLSYKVSSGWKRMNSINVDTDKRAIDDGQINTELDYAIDEDTNFSLSAGATKNNIYFILSQVLQKEQNGFYGPIRSTNGYAKADFEKGGFKSRLYWAYSDSLWSTGSVPIDSILNSFDYENRYQFDTSEANSVIIGAGAHYDYAKSNIFPNDEFTDSQLAWDGFLQDDLRLSEKWKLSVSGRFDKYPKLDFEPSGRLALMYYPNPEDMFRISGGYSFRNPTLTEQYVNLQVPLKFLGNLPVGFLGSSNLQPEIYTTYELDYEGHRMDGRLRPFVNLFYTDIRSFIYPVQNGGGALHLDSQYVNAGEAISAGGETGTEFDINRQFTILGNYAFNNVDYDHDRLREHYHPKHKITAGLLAKFFNNRLKARITGHYVSSSHTTFGSFPLLAQPPKLQNYFTEDVWVGYEVSDSVEVSVAGLNVSDNRHQEIPGGEEVGSLILGKLLIKF